MNIWDDKLIKMRIGYRHCLIEFRNNSKVYKRRIIVNNTKPFFSVITICYNAELFIEETIQSVISQKYKYFEYIIIDGKSSDQTMSIINRYKKFIHLIISEKDNGISDAFNKGIRYAKGDLIVLINAGDLLIPEALFLVADAYDPKIGLYKGNMLYRDDKKKLDYEVKTDKYFSNPPWFANKAGHQACYVSPEVYQEVGNYKVEYKYFMDIDFLIRASKKKIPMKYIDDNLAVFRVGGVSYSCIFLRIPEAYDMVRKNGGNLLQGVGYVLFLLAKRFCKRLIEFFFPNSIEKYCYKIKN